MEEAHIFAPVAKSKNRKKGVKKIQDVSVVFTLIFKEIMKEIILTVLTILISMFLIDAIWLRTMFKILYVPNIGHLLASKMNLAPAIIFYILYALALYVLVVRPELDKGEGYLKIWMLGILFGLVTYGTYDLTNQTVLKDWPWVVTVVDLAWGATLTGAVAVFSTYIARNYILT